MAPAPRPLNARSLVVAAAAWAAAALICAGSGCELAIGDTVAAFACDPGGDTCPMNEVCDPVRHQCIGVCAPGACPTNMECDTSSHLCTLADASVVTDGDAIATDATDAATDRPGADAGADTGSADTGTTADSPAETTTNETGPCTGLICRCIGNAACDSHICADQLTVGSALYTAAGGSNFCTKPCCTSADCDPSTVCYATSSSASSGTYCVLPAWLERSPQLGTSIGGQTCMGNADCRSGLCSNSMCADTCCSTGQSGTECGSGTTCSFGTFPGVAAFDQNFSPFCGSAGTGTNGSNCNFPSDCASNFCTGRPGVCQDACRSASDCGGQGYSCGYGRDQSNVVFPACFSYSFAGAEGQPCMRNSDCESGLCDMAGLCTDVCFSDTDCSVSGWHCRPEQIMLRSGGVASVLCCGP
jgi:hypothetical protein